MEGGFRDRLPYDLIIGRIDFIGGGKHEPRSRRLSGNLAEELAELRIPFAFTKIERKFMFPFRPSRPLGGGKLHRPELRVFGTPGVVCGVNRSCKNFKPRQLKQVRVC